MHAIEIDHLTYSYPGAAHPVLQDITVCVEQGDFLAIVGNNGCGKSTFCKALNGLIPQFISGDFSGRVLACGLDTRCYRMAGYAHWHNLDLPETMAVREKLLPESGAISQIAMSAMDDWGGKISEQNVPVLIVIEGLTMYLNAKDFCSDSQPFFPSHYICGNHESYDSAALQGEIH